MTREENIFIAKRMLVDTIYRSAKLEGIAVTYAQTIEILENINCGDIKPSAVNDLLNLKNSWKYILDNLDSNMDLGLIKNCHSIIGKGMDIPLYEIGEFRISGVGIGGTKWRPKEPNIERLHNELEEIKKNPNAEDRSINIFLWAMQSQMFRDGNKRVATLIANFEMIKNGAGIISVPENDIAKFKMLLVNFYETDNKEEIKAFLTEKCVYRDMEFLSNEDRAKSEKPSVLKALKEVDKTSEKQKLSKAKDIEI